MLGLLKISAVDPDSMVSLDPFSDPDPTGQKVSAKIGLTATPVAWTSFIED
jgi:hypothetical protein